MVHLLPKIKKKESIDAKVPLIYKSPSITKKKKKKLQEAYQSSTKTFLICFLSSLNSLKPPTLVTLRTFLGVNRPCTSSSRLSYYGDCHIKLSQLLCCNKIINVRYKNMDNWDFFFSKLEITTQMHVPRDCICCYSNLKYNRVNSNNTFLNHDKNFKRDKTTFSN